MGLAFTLSIALASPKPSAGATFPFAWLIEAGGQFTLYSRPDGLSVWVSSQRLIFSVVNDQKSGSSIGTAVIYVWQYPVPGPLAGSFGPVAGLGILKFAPPFEFTAHLGLVQTPAGDLLTTIGLGFPNGLMGAVDTTVRGAWLFGNGTSVGGGTAQDLVIAGFWVGNTPTPLGGLTANIDTLHVAGSPIGDWSPFYRVVLTPECDVPSCVAGGVYHGQADGNAMAIRSFAADTIFGQGTGEHGHLLIAHDGGGDYALVACSSAQGSFFEVGIPIASPYKGCTLSGTGSFAQLSGSVDYCCGGDFLTNNFKLTVTPYSIAP